MAARFLLTSLLLLAFASTALAEDRQRVRVGEAVVQVEFARGVPAAQRALLLQWVRQSARSVALYYERFPVKAVRLRLKPRLGSALGGGFASGEGGAHIEVSVGRLATRSVLLEDDWLLTHEMVHLAFPNVLEKHHWIEEGIATYVEPVARVRAGVLSAERFWRELLTETPQGLPQSGDRGLDNTPTWGRTYWGGAIYCLLADIEIRKRTDNRLGLEHALRAINRAGGSLDVGWTLESTLRIGDEAVGVPVLSELYERYRESPVAPDLAHVWADLGVRLGEDGIVYDEEAPGAPIRRALTARWENAGLGEAFVSAGAGES